jgi:hypothetical protein
MAQADQLDWPRACVDRTSVPAARGGLRRARTPRIAVGRAASVM